MAVDVLLLDGATGTELDRRGVDITLPLWSARALIDAPDELRRVHVDYLAAGAGGVTANTFRTHRRTLDWEGLGERAVALTRQAVEIARAACDERKQGALVLGSVAPLEDCYRPDLAPDEAACRAEHGEMIGNLLEAGVDLLLIETMNNVSEAIAAVDAARTQAPGRWIISFCAKSQGPPGILLSGEPISAILDSISDAYAVGVNCVAAGAIERQIVHLRELLPQMRLIAYGNIGYADEAGNWVTTDAVVANKYATYARRWFEAGATIIGGCCGTTPDTIREIAAVLDQ